jgi:hypothetical protein
MIDQEDTPKLHIRRQLDRLDTVAADFESRWGIGRLQSLAPPEVREKWERQNEKLAEAIGSADAVNIENLVDGTIRGWQLLERLATEAGHQPYDPAFLEYRIDGRRYVVARSLVDAQALHKPHGGDAVIVTVGELVRLFIERHSKAFGMPEIKLSDDVERLPALFWKNGGDPIEL